MSSGLYLVIHKGKIILNVDVEGLIILRLDPIIPKGRIILNVDVEGLIILRLDLVIPKGRIVQDVDVGIYHSYTGSRNSERKDRPRCRCWD